MGMLGEPDPLLIILEPTEHETLRIRFINPCITSFNSQRSGFPDVLVDIHSISEVLIDGSFETIKSILSSILDDDLEPLSQLAKEKKLLLRMPVSVPDSMDPSMVPAHSIRYFNPDSVKEGIIKTFKNFNGLTIRLASKERAHWYLQPTEKAQDEYLRWLAQNSADMPQIRTSRRAMLRLNRARRLQSQL